VHRSSITKTFIGNWSAQDLGRYQLIQAETDSFALALILEPMKPPVLQGENGYSRKGSDPKKRLDVLLLHPTEIHRRTHLGRHALYGRRRKVGKTTSSAPRKLDDNVAGWDWFSIQLSDTTELMLYNLRLTDGTNSPFSSGTVVHKKRHQRKNFQQAISRLKFYQDTHLKNQAQSIQSNGRFLCRNFHSC
jgi:predicted secreted hydrolase